MSEGRLRAAILGLALAGVGITSYLVAVRYSGSQVLCTSGGCETVQHSRYAKAAGVPVAVLGLVGYLLIVASALRRGETAAFVGAAVASAGLAFGGYLIWVQVARIGATCEWCLASDGLLALLVPLTFLRLASVETPGADPGRVRWRPGRAVGD